MQPHIIHLHTFSGSLYRRDPPLQNPHPHDSKNIADQLPVQPGTMIPPEATITSDEPQPAEAGTPKNTSSSTTEYHQITNAHGQQVPSYNDRPISPDHAALTPESGLRMRNSGQLSVRRRRALPIHRSIGRPLGYAMQRPRCICGTRLIVMMTWSGGIILLIMKVTASVRLTLCISRLVRLRGRGLVLVRIVNNQPL